MIIFVEYDLVKSECVVEALRTVDRRFFAPKLSQAHAYFDHPLKEGNIHISAPHMYCTVAENLDLVPNSNLSFLNVGSGTGYFSCLVGQILGPKSTSFGIELKEDVLEHAENAIKEWKRESAHDIVAPEIKFFQGNGLNIISKGESRFGYDRIYVGASIDRTQLPRIENFLAPGGVLVVPVEDSLIKVTRPRVSDSLQISVGMHYELITNVYFATLAENPKLEVTIPSKIWDQTLHTTFPRDFQESIWVLLLCNNSSNRNLNVAASIPKDIWLFIFSFMSRHWFNVEDSEISSPMEVDRHNSLLIDQAEVNVSSHENNSNINSLLWIVVSRTSTPTEDDSIFREEDEEMDVLQTSLIEESVYSEEVDKIRSVSI